MLSKRHFYRFETRSTERENVFLDKSDDEDFIYFKNRGFQDVWAAQVEAFLFKDKFALLFAVSPE